MRKIIQVAGLAVTMAVSSVAVSGVAQARIGTKIHFSQTTYPEAVAALEELDRYLTRVRHLVGLVRPYAIRP